MEVLFATHNKSKLQLYRNMLKEDGVKIVGLDEHGIDYDVKEVGKNSKEIAIKKVKEYNKLSNYITISEDTGLYFDNIPDEKQPGVNVNTVNGKKLSEEERIEYYKSLISDYGGLLNGYWIKDIAIADNNGNIFTYKYKIKKIFTNKVHKLRNEGYPLDSISITPEYNKYTVELTDEENMRLNESCNKEIHNFIVTTLNGLKKH